jgi:hypothetical protein
MKTYPLIFGCWVALAFCGNAGAQDTNRVPDMDQSVRGVDASVHVGLDEIALQPPPPPQAPVKPPATYSHWGITTPTQPPSVQFGAAPVAAAPASNGASTAPPNQNNEQAILPDSNSSAPSGEQEVPSISWTAGHVYSAPDPSAENGPAAPVKQPGLLNNSDGSTYPNTKTVPMYSEFNSATSLRRPEPIDFSKSNPQQLPEQPVSDGFRSPFSEQPQVDGSFELSPTQPQGGSFTSPLTQQVEEDGFSTPIAPGQFKPEPASYSWRRHQVQVKSSSKGNRAQPKPLGSNSQKTVIGIHARSTADIQSKQESQSVLH